MADQTAQYLARFRSASPEQRHDAVIKLGKSGDKRAIPLLQQMASTEPDPTLHDLMLKAIQHIQSANLSTANAPPQSAPPGRTVWPYSSQDRPLPNSSASPYALVESEAAPPEPGKPVSDRERRLAKSRLDYALSLHISKQNDKALAVLAEAAHTDPSILETQMGRNLAMALTGEDGPRAIELVFSKSNDPNVLGAASRPEFKVTLSAELFDTVIELIGLQVVIVLLFALGVYGIGQVFDRVFSKSGSGLGVNMSDIVATDVARVQQSGDSPSAKATEIAALQQASSTLNQFAASTSSLSSVFSLALSFGVRTMLSTILAIIAAYIVGILIGGSGGLLRFFRYLTRAYIAVYLALLIGVALLYFLASNPSLSTHVKTTLSGIALLLFGGEVLVGFLVIDYAAARGHHFGLFKGFVSVAAGNFVLSILLGLLGVSSILSGL